MERHSMSQVHDALPDVSFEESPVANGSSNGNGSAGLKGWLANNVANASAITIMIVAFVWVLNDMRDAARQNSTRMDLLLQKSEEREMRAWEQRAKDRESAMKHGDEAVRQVTMAVTQQTIEIGRMTKAIEGLTSTLREVHP